MADNILSYSTTALVTFSEDLFSNQCFVIFSGGVRRLLLLLFPHCRIPLRRGIRTRPAMF